MCVGGRCNKPQAEFYSYLEKVRAIIGSGQKSGSSALSFGDSVKNRLQGVRWEQEDPEGVKQDMGTRTHTQSPAGTGIWKPS